MPIPPVAMPIPVNVVFQGGGAKLATLVGAVKAVLQCPDIEVRGVAGTSAGSIAAAMLAFRFDIDQVVDRVRNAKKDITKISRMPGWLMTVIKAWRGDPLIDEAAMRTILKTILSDPATLRWPGQAARDVTQILVSDAHIPLRILTTDFVNSGLHVIGGPGSSASVHLLDSLVDSCAIPIAVRTFRHLKNSQRYIDGGICDNLPSADIFGNSHLTIGFSFRPDPANDSGKWTLLQYSQNLLSVAINRSVERTVAQLGESNVCRLTCEINWLNFAGAADFIADPARLKVATDEASSFLRNWVSAYGQRQNHVLDINHEKVHSDLTQELNIAYEADAPFERLECSELISVLTARSLAPETEGITDDSLVYSKFSVCGDPVSWVRIWDMSYIGSPRHTEGVIRIVDSQGQEVKPLKFMVLKREEQDGIGRTIFLNFIPPLTGDRSPYQMTHQVKQRRSLNLVFDTQKKSDFSWLSSRTFRSIQSAFIIVHCPKATNAHERDLFQDLKFPQEQQGLLPTDGCGQSEIERLGKEISVLAPNGFKSFARKTRAAMKPGEAIGIVIGI